MNGLYLIEEKFLGVGIFVIFTNPENEFMYDNFTSFWRLNKVHDFEKIQLSEEDAASNICSLTRRQNRNVFWWAPYKGPMPGNVERVSLNSWRGGNTAC